MARKIPTPHDVSEREFYLAYGRALAHWATLERRIGLVFITMSGMEDAKGWAVYFSAHSFRARVEMTSALIPLVRARPLGKAFLSRALGLAMTYSGYRNALAHDDHRMRLDEPATMTSFSKTSHVIASPSGQEIDTAQLKRLGANFFHLAFAIDWSRGRRTLVREPELCLELLDQLPLDPLATEVDQTRANALRSEIGQHRD